MKKIFLLFITFVFATAVFAVEATVLSVSGRVEFREANEWVVLREGDKIEKGTIISTGYKSQAVLEFKGTKFTFESLTRGTIEEIIEEEDFDYASLFIDMGAISAIVNRQNGRRTNFRVGSPVAVSSVRGTSFRFTAAGKLTVERGVVCLALPNAEKGIDVWAGQQGEVNGASGTVLSPEHQEVQTVTSGDNLTKLKTAEQTESIGYTTAVIMYYATEDMELGGKTQINTTNPMGDVTFSFEY